MSTYTRLHTFGDDEADVRSGKISVSSPIARVDRQAGRRQGRGAAPREGCTSMTCRRCGTRDERGP